MRIDLAPLEKSSIGLFQVRKGEHFLAIVMNPVWDTIR